MWFHDIYLGQHVSVWTPLLFDVLCSASSPIYPCFSGLHPQKYFPRVMKQQRWTLPRPQKLPRGWKAPGSLFPPAVSADIADDSSCTTSIRPTNPDAPHATLVQSECLTTIRHTPKHVYFPHSDLFVTIPLVAGSAASSQPSQKQPMASIAEPACSTPARIQGCPPHAQSRCE